MTADRSAPRVADSAAGATAVGSGAVVAQPAPPTRSNWRNILTPVVWLALAACAMVLLSLFWNMFAMALGAALHAEITIDEQIPVFWGLVTVCAVLTLTAVAALIGRRWVALVVALALGGVGGIAATMVFANGRSVIAPVVHVDPLPVPCQCYSGSVCDCPGG